MKLFNFSPITQKRLARFRASRVAYGSLKLLVVLYILSLFAEVLCNSRPLYMRYNGEHLFPFLENLVPEAIIADTGLVQINYRDFVKTPAFTKNASNRVVFAPIPYGPDEVLDTQDLERAKEVTVSLVPQQPIGRFNLTADGRVVREDGCEQFFPGMAIGSDKVTLTDLFAPDAGLQGAIATRLSGAEAGVETFVVKPSAGRSFKWESMMVRLSAQAAGAARGDIRVNLSLSNDFIASQHYTFVRVNPGESASAVRLKEPVQGRVLAPGFYDALAGYAQRGFVKNLFAADRLFYTDPDTGVVYAVRTTNNIRYPFPPTSLHLMGLDGSGRDIFARIVYGMRMSLSFGLLLSTWAVLLGVIIGAIQGFFGGKVDIAVQRFTEIWSAMPFLYVMILVGAVFGRSFFLLLFCYGLFNWIGMSAYMRGEFYRLRNRPFVDAARCQGLSNVRIIFRHILPNALTPIVTLFPFNLVGAISLLVALDFLGFGLPPLTPSWGELLQQAQTYRWAWWLILFPSGAIFTVMFLTVMIGEGVRNAFDPKPYSRME